MKNLCCLKANLTWIWLLYISATTMISYEPLPSKNLQQRFHEFFAARRTIFITDYCKYVCVKKI